MKFSFSHLINPAVFAMTCLVCLLSSCKKKEESAAAQEDSASKTVSKQRQELAGTNHAPNQGGVKSAPGTREYTGKAAPLPRLDDPRYAEIMTERQAEAERKREALRKTHVPADTPENRAALAAGADPLDLPDAQGSTPDAPLPVINKALLSFMPEIPEAPEGEELTPEQQKLAEKIHYAANAELHELPVIDQTPAEPAVIAEREQQIAQLARSVGPEPDYQSQPEAYGAWLEKRKALKNAYVELAMLAHRPANTEQNRRALLAGANPLDLPAADGGGPYTGPAIIDKRLLPDPNLAEVRDVPMEEQEQE